MRAPDERDPEYTVDYAYLLREADGSVTVEHDRHVEGLFGREDWLRWLTDAGFRAEVVPDPFEREAFVGIKPE